VSKETRTYKTGEFIYQEGDASDCAYIIEAGRVELLKNGPSGPARIGGLSKGELLGEMGVLDQGPRNTSARAETTTKLEVIPRADFLKMIEKDPQAALKIMTRMAKRLRDSDEKLASTPAQSPKAPVTTSTPPTPSPLKTGGQAALPAPPAAGGALVPFMPIDPQTVPMHHLNASFQRQGLLDRLVDVFRGGRTAARRRPRTVAITSLSLDAEYDQRPYLLETLSNLDGLVTRATTNDFPAPPEGIAVRDLRQARLQARPLQAAEKADVLVWGGEDAEGRVISMYFSNKTLPDTDEPGFFPQDALLVVPGDFDETWGALLRGAAMAAAAGKPSTDYPLLPILAEQAAAIALQPPSSLTPAEQATVRAMFGHIAAQAGLAFGRTQLIDAAIQCYQAALPDMPHETTEDWVSLNKALGLLLLERAEKTNDEGVLRRAADAFTNALSGMQRNHDPRAWGNLHVRLGAVQFRIDMVSGDEQALREALSHYQTALTAFPRFESPWRWADVMTAIGQVLQVYGDHLKNTDILQKAVDVCQSALEIRSAEASPLLYAATRNNMGSALFLLARHTGDPEYMRLAALSFRDALAVHRSTGSGGPLARTILKNLDRAETALNRIENRRVAQPVWAGGDLPETSQD